MADASVLRPDLSLVLERITDGFFALDVQWRISYINAEARKLLHAQEHCVGAHWLEIFPLARGRLFEREYERAMHDQQSVQFVEYSKTAALWLEVKAYPSADGLSVYFRDVSSRIEAQREVERNARRQQALIDFGRTALAGATIDEIVVDALDLVRDVLETPVAELIAFERDAKRFAVRRSSGWGLHASFERQVPLVAHLEHVVRTGEPFVCPDVRTDHRAPSLAQLKKNNVLSCIAVLIGTPADPKGVIAVYYPLARTFSVGDVRFVQSVAQTVAETDNALESNRRMAQVLESIRDAFVAVDRNLRITYVNSQMARYFNVEPSAVIGRSVVEFTPQFDRDGVALKSFKEALAHERAVTYETAIRDRWYEARLYPFATGVAAYVRDVTPRKTEEERILHLNAELERRVAQRTQQLELANKELESFSYSVSHDLRAPLRAIDGFSQALAEDYAGALDDRARGYVDRVRRAAQRMADLIDALLRLAKVARAPISFDDVNLSALAQSVAQDCRDGEPERRVTVRIVEGLRAAGEPNLLQVLLQNLVGNAWKFTRHAAAASIEVGRNADGEFFVRDNGAGFDMAYGNKLFGAFQRLHPADEYEGTGIGLATVARIVHRHGGAIRAEGAVGAGATFYFTLPASKE
ncbi:MAG: PAS domain-containing protein [Candidatus Eremiobacteraeota bacterium]|nr:PAS domain-containing protein [Candidatus Eremiobacteraeota bacterium]